MIKNSEILICEQRVELCFCSISDFHRDSKEEIYRTNNPSSGNPNKPRDILSLYKIAGELLLDYALRKRGLNPATSQVTIGRYGKPELVEKDFEFNISHDNDLIVLAMHEAIPVGVDVMKRKNVNFEDDVVKVFSTKNEWKSLCRGALEDQPENSLRLFTAKEAAAKAIGTGFHVNPCELEFGSCPKQNSISRVEFEEKTIIVASDVNWPYPGYLLSCALDFTCEK